MNTASHTFHRLTLAAGACLIALVLAASWTSNADASKHHGPKHHHHHKSHAYLPPKHELFHGVSDTGATADFLRFGNQTGSHPAVLQDFFHWGTPLTTGALQRWLSTKTRGMLSLSTAPGGGHEIITPRGIATGGDDHYMLRLRQSIAKSKQVVYIRLMAEMNGSWNPYSAYNANGTRRDSAHSTGWFKKAWKRFDLIVKGGKRKAINQKLRKLHLPRILKAKSENDAVYHRFHVRKNLPHAKVAMVWNPQTSGSPNKKGNRPQDYFPGRKYVDWVGADVYSKYSNRTLWRNLNHFYSRYKKMPFLIGEYSPWDNDLRGNFVKKLFKWSRTHGRTRMLNYYRSVDITNLFNLQFYLGAKNALHHELNSKRFAPRAPEYTKRHH